MIVNGYFLEPISAHNARKLPEGTALVMLRIWKDSGTNAVTRQAWYRGEVRYRKTVAGMDVAFVSKPDHEWPDIPTWQRGWIWLENIADINQFYRIAERVEGC